MEEIRRIPITALRESPFNPRKTFDVEALRKLAWTIECDGVLQPLEVRPIPGQWDDPEARERYEIVFGHRRFRAAQLAKQEDVPCVVRERDDESARRVQLIENIQRDEVSPLEQAQALRLLMDEHHMKAEDVGAHVGKSRAWVYAQLRLLNLQPGLQAEVEQGRMTSEVAQAVAALHPKLQERAAEALRGRRIMAFTGAGISVESGIAPFRGPGGLWSRIDPARFEIIGFLFAGYPAESPTRERRLPLDEVIRTSP